MRSTSAPAGSASLPSGSRSTAEAASRAAQVAISRRRRGADERRGPRRDVREEPRPLRADHEDRRHLAGHALRRSVQRRHPDDPRLVPVRGAEGALAPRPRAASPRCPRCLRARRRIDEGSLRTPSADVSEARAPRAGAPRPGARIPGWNGVSLELQSAEGDRGHRCIRAVNSGDLDEHRWLVCGAAVAHTAPRLGGPDDEAPAGALRAASARQEFGNARRLCLRARMGGAERGQPRAPLPGLERRSGSRCTTASSSTSCRNRIGCSASARATSSDAPQAAARRLPAFPLPGRRAARIRSGRSAARPSSCTNG